MTDLSTGDDGDRASRLLELRERVRAATGTARDIDGLLWRVSEPGGNYVPFGESKVLYRRDPEDRIAFDAPPDFTSSIDAALALVERVLPGWVWNVGGCQPDFLTDKDRPLSCDLMGPVTWTVVDREVGEEPIYDHHSSSAFTAPLAILDALLSALIAQASSEAAVTPSNASGIQSLSEDGGE